MKMGKENDFPLISCDIKIAVSGPKGLYVPSDTPTQKI